MNLSKAIILPLGALGLAASLVACGSGSDSSTSSAEAPAVTSSQAPNPQSSANGDPNNSAPQSSAVREELRACLAKKGITLPSRAPDAVRPTAVPTGAPQAGQGFAGGRGLPAGVDQQSFQAAMQACGGNFGGGFQAGANGPGSTAFQAYRSCLTDHGVTLPPTAGARPNLDGSDPKLSAAMKICAPLMPTRQPAPAAD
ncbi:MAG: hypothetical protein Q7L55_00505 [Actinomycetota bacterium]|nr:hypothetical protein [Actinomycetota bacterium]